MMAALVSVAYADDDDYENDREYWYRSGASPDIEVWTNKGNGAHYYYGEDVAVYFRADNDCYAVVYDVDPSGEVNILFPSSYYGSSYVEGGRVYRIPDYNDDFRFEISGSAGTDHIFAVASFDYLNPPDFMRYVGYDYGDGRYYDDDYFAISVRGDLDGFVTRINARICTGPYAVAHTKFFADTNYRHHRHYRYWDYDPYYVSSIWVGCDFPGSEIWIDGVFIGIAPVLVPRVIVGYHWVWAYYGGYPCYQRYFYVPSYQRYYVDIRFDQRYKDHHYRRHAFRNWVFEEKKYRNEGGFKERAREIREKQIRTRSLPASIVSDFADRGVISREAPIVKEVRAREVDRGDRSRESGRNYRPDNTQPGGGDVKGPRTRSDESIRDSERRGSERENDVRDKFGRAIDDGGAIMPEGRGGEDKSRGQELRDESGGKSDGRSGSYRTRSSEGPSGPDSKGSRFPDNGSVMSRDDDTKRESERDGNVKEGGKAEKQKVSKSESRKNDSGKDGEKSEKRSSGKSSKSKSGKERSR
jgi:hypothetical protein